VPAAPFAGYVLEAIPVATAGRHKKEIERFRHSADNAAVSG
jgi:hypothetical protein